MKSFPTYRLLEGSLHRIGGKVTTIVYFLTAKFVLMSIYDHNDYREILNLHVFVGHVGAYFVYVQTLLHNVGILMNCWVQKIADLFYLYQ